MVDDYLDGLHRPGAFAGATPARVVLRALRRQSMTQADIDAGRCVAEVGVAPTEPTRVHRAALRSSTTTAARGAEIGVSRG